MEETLGKLEKLYSELLTLKALWTEWEEQMWQLEEVAKKGLETHTNTLHEHATVITALEKTADTMAPTMSTSARIAVHHRLEQLRQKMRQMSKVGIPNHIRRLTRMPIPLGFCLLFTCMLTLSANICRNTRLLATAQM